MRDLRVFGVTALCALVGMTALACGSGGESSFGDGSGNGFGDGSGDGSGGDQSAFAGQVGGSGGSDGTGGSVEEGEECASAEAAATLTKKPVDIVFVIDNSGSMGGEIEEVQNQVNQNFAQIIEASGLDYRVIMISRHGTNPSESVCISAPLSGTDCSPVPAQPAQTAKFFHYNVEIGSHDAWCKLLDRYSKPDNTDGYTLHPNGWGELLRQEAFKTIVVISDDGVNCSWTPQGGSSQSFNDSNQVVNGATAAADFDTALLTLSPAQFGTAQARNYVFHSIVALAPYDQNDLTLAYPATEPVTTSKCTPGAADPGTGHQSVSTLTGGLRYPTCGLNYSTIFQAMAQSVITGAKIGCEFDLPAPPPGKTLDLETTTVKYTNGTTGVSTNFGQVANAAACQSGKFYIEANTAKLCPDTCATVQADDKADVKVLFGCSGPKSTPK